MFCQASVRVHMNYTCMDQAADAPQRVANRCTARVANRCTARMANRCTARVANRCTARDGGL